LVANAVPSGVLPKNPMAAPPDQMPACGSAATEKSTVVTLTSPIRQTACTKVRRHFVVCFILLPSSGVLTCDRPRSHAVCIGTTVPKTFSKSKGKVVSDQWAARREWELQKELLLVTRLSPTPLKPEQL